MARRFAARARRRRWRVALPWLSVLLVAVLGGVGVGLVYGTGLFGVTEIRVTGTSLTTPDQVRAAAAVPVGTPLARVGTAAVERRVGALPPVRRVTVRREWPHRLVVQVAERTPVAVVPVRPAGYALLDDAGVAYWPVPDRPAELPLVRVTAPGPDDVTTRAALAVLRTLPSALRDPMVALVAEAPTRIRLEYPDDRVVIWGDATENEEKARVATSLLAGTAKVIDVSAPSVVTVR
jgi:cell division protein FtsQ